MNRPALSLFKQLLLENASEVFSIKHIGTGFRLSDRVSLVSELKPRSYIDLSCMKYGTAQSIPLIPNNVVLIARPRGM